MSYNTRRSGGNTNFNNGMGGRGRPIQQNFVSSGQYQQAQKPGGAVGQGQQSQVRPQQQQQQVRPQQQQQQQQARPLQQPVRPQQQAQQQQAQQQQAQQQVRPQQEQQQSFPRTAPMTAPLKSALKKEVKTEATNVSPMVQQQQQQQQQPQQQQQQQQQVKPVTPVVPPTAPAVPPTLTPAKQEAMAMEAENGDVKKKTLIVNVKGKISKKEKRGRRNRRLKKILVPKNALMVLNELVGGHKFNFLEKDPNPANFYAEPDTYIASVTIEGTEHVGYGKSKTAAKTAAAETALRHIILSKISSPLAAAQSTQSINSEGDVSMEVDGEKQEEEEDVSWLHVASFAMHKLFSSWYAEGDDKTDQAKLLARTGVADMAAQLKEIKPFTGPPKTRKPAKQLPQNPELLNPVMLLNQMRDDVTYEEFSKTGTAPNIEFVIKTTVDGQDFYGKGGNKKIARKNCAYAACSKLYGITYITDEFDPSNASIGIPMY